MSCLSIRVAAMISATLMLVALGGCGSTDSKPAAITPAAEVARADNPDPRVVTLCYLGLEFSSDTLLATTVQVDVDNRMMGLVGAGDKMVAQYPEGMHGISIALPRASKKKREKNKIAVELKRFVYTKIVIEQAEGKKSRKRLIVRVLEDGEEIRTRTIEL